MSYIIPDGCSINFNISGEYNSPVCGQIIFTIGSTGELTANIISNNITLMTSVDIAKFFHGDIIKSDSVSILSLIDEEIIDLMWPIQNNNVDISLSIGNEQVEILPDINSSSMVLKSIIEECIMRSTDPQFLPNTSGSGSIIAPWKKPSEVERGNTFRWGDGSETDIDVDGKIFPPIEIEINSSMIYKPSAIINDESAILFGITNKLNAGTSFKISSFIERDFGILSSYGIGDGKDMLINSRFVRPDEVDLAMIVISDESGEHDRNLKAHSLTPGATDREHTVAWGPFSYYSLCRNSYRTPSGCKIEFEFPNKHDLIPNICENIQFYVDNYSTKDIRCEVEHWHTGGRDPYTIVDPPISVVVPGIVYPTKKGLYYMINTITVEEVTTKKSIEVLHFDATIDKESWLWSYNVTIASKSDLDLIRPSGNTLGQLKITLNGWVFYCTVEGWSESRTFGQTAWTVTGRSPSMMFGSPIAQQKSKTVETGSQGITEISNAITTYQAPATWPVDLQNWTLDASAYTLTQTGFDPSLNWYLPPNTISYSDKTDIEFIKELADSIGAYIQTDPSENKIKIAPRFSYQPWNWTPSNAGITWKAIIEAQCAEIGQTNSLKSYVQGVYVIGESPSSNDSSSGADSLDRSIAIEVVRDGYTSSSADFAPMVTSQYVTTEESALEKGRTILADQGEWINHTIRFGYLCNKSDDPDGLFNVGDMISTMERGTPWYGQCSGITINAVLSNGGVYVEQVLEVSEYKES